MSDSSKGKSTAKKVGDEVKVPAGAEFVVGPDSGAASVRSGGTYRFNAPGEYVIGKARANGNGITGTTYTPGALKR